MSVKTRPASGKICEIGGEGGNLIGWYATQSFVDYVVSEK